MSDTPPDRASSGGEGPDRRQAALAVVACLALVLAAFAAPAANVSVGEFDFEDDEEPDADQTQGGNGRFQFRPLNFWDDIAEWLVSLRGDGTGGVPQHQCTITLQGDRFPGSTVTARITYDGEPLADAPVWFNDRRVGRTDADGTVSGRVPYEHELVVRVRVEDRPDCRTSRVSLDRSDGRRAGADPPASRARTTASLVAGAVAPVGVAAAQESSSEPTASYPVDADATLQVLGEPHPGSTVTVQARLDDKPFPNASLTVNGEPVGRTDTAGRARLAVPDDGTAQLRIHVRRGEFNATRTVNVLLLRTRLEPMHLAVVPGAPAVVNVTYAGDPLDGASVAVAGEHRGETGSDGRRRVALPVDPTATVVVSARDQTATTSVAATYWPAAAVFVGAVAALCTLAYRRRGSRGVAGVLGVVAGLLAVLVADAFYGPAGRYVVLGALVTVLALSAAYRWRRDLASGAETTTGLLRRVLDRLWTLAGHLGDLPGALATLGRYLREWTLGAVIDIATVLGSLVDTLRSVQWSGRELVALVIERVREIAANGLRELQNRPGVAVALTAAALVGTAGAYALAGREGVVFAVGALVLTTAVWLWRRLGTGDALDESAVGAFDSPNRRPSPDPSSSTLRELWRAFARAVVPDGWRTRTPSEVARAAVDQGYPREPVEAFTDLFREVEYGRRSLSTAVRDRARTAYAAIRDRDRGDEP